MIVYSSERMQTQMEWMGTKLPAFFVFSRSSIKVSLILVQSYAGLIRLRRSLMNSLECGSFARPLFPTIIPAMLLSTSTRFTVQHI